MHGCSLLSKRDDVAHVRTAIGKTVAMKPIRDHDGDITGPFYIEDGAYSGTSASTTWTWPMARSPNSNGRTSST